METPFHMQHRIDMLQKDGEIYKMAIDSLMFQKQQDHANIADLTKRLEEKSSEVEKLDAMYKDVVISLVEQIKTLGEEAEESKKQTQSLKNTLTGFKNKSRKLNERSYQVRKLKKFIKEAIEILDDVIIDAEDVVYKS
ncbi:ORF39 [Betabaculovirus altermyunipunctae]|uniref:ORF39 n=1 Tax=Betabaculovirus altermyunipunctae TaxID=3051996 RepID=A0A1S5YE56_9BBAC|nr:ORF39 [Betabaculovirus altermyunipunctae]AQQ80306.1 ORF39 [Betabaculovirus altermyunipunctae]